MFASTYTVYCCLLPTWSFQQGEIKVTIRHVRNPGMAIWQLEGEIGLCEQSNSYSDSVLFFFSHEDLKTL